MIIASSTPHAGPPTSRSRIPMARALAADTYRAWWRHKLLYGAWGLACFVVLVAIEVALGLAGWPDARLVATPVMLLLGWALLSTGVARAVSEERRGRPVRAGALLPAGVGELLSVGAWMVLVAFVLAGALVGLRAVGIALLGPQVDDPVTAIALAVVYLAGTFAGGSFLAFVPAVVLRRAGPVAALRVGWSAARGHRTALGCANLLVFSSWLVGPVLFIAAVFALHQQTYVTAMVLWAYDLCFPLPWILPAIAAGALEGAGSCGPDLARVFE